MILKHALVAGVMMGLAAGTALADCDPNAAEAQVSACLAQDLRDSDKRINAVYKALGETLDEDSRLALRNEQRAWLKRRDKTCGLDTKESDRERWLQAIMADPAKTICVVRFTFSRVTDLNTLLKAKGTVGGAPDLPPAPSAPIPLAPAMAMTIEEIPLGMKLVDEGYAATSLTQRHSGRWYYEVWIDRGKIAQKGDVLMQIAAESSSTAGVVRNVSIRRNHPEAGPVNIAMAVDLDQGFVYVRQNGEWKAVPGSSGGVPLRLNNGFFAVVRASSPVGELVGNGLVRVNLGSRPFEYAMPDGYRPFGER
ncbi:hypothetical protein A6A04_03575 [Paramagnetospirillum marisnigri]|uniref:Lysozyme inhibitor LprI-like N-terminal domain-containing protein n=1 Tax=Paramagnetospirillum marisnigri TaxID=1285242 RepID=A0A178MKK6_9PROT|nr:lysozyme inhibitor LprI family protein [Paramagnetospirillum marisnigri]OAN49206.1 hypothetical protein A6A04_03575 [Paramagnetospirillum marisnigri]